MRNLRNLIRNHQKAQAVGSILSVLILLLALSRQSRNLRRLVTRHQKVIKARSILSTLIMLVGVALLPGQEARRSWLTN
jgi:hypothetical protein